MFFWNRSIITNSWENEYQILYWHVKPSAEGHELIPVTDSFSEFIERYCLGGLFWKTMGWAKSARKNREYEEIAEAPTSRQ
jgi:hypothetical protein